MTGISKFDEICKHEMGVIWCIIMCHPIFSCAMLGNWMTFLPARNSPWNGFCLPLNIHTISIAWWSSVLKKGLPTGKTNGEALWILISLADMRSYTVNSSPPSPSGLDFFHPHVFVDEKIFAHRPTIFIHNPLLWQLFSSVSTIVCLFSLRYLRPTDTLTPLRQRWSCGMKPAVHVDHHPKKAKWCP